MEVKDKFYISFWQYYNFGQMDETEAAEDQKALYGNLAYSLNYDVSRSRPEQMHAYLDACAQRGIQTTVVDSRMGFRTLLRLGEEEYERGVKECIREFGEHPAVFGFMVGDEPNKNTVEAAIRSIQIVQKYTDKPALTNFFPYWMNGEKDFAGVMGVDGFQYEALLDDFIERSGLKILAYDCYSQVLSRESERDFGVRAYFKNLNFFRRIAKKHNIPCWTSLETIGYWEFRIPSKTDLLWQLNTAVAHGMKGIQWFEIYEMEHPYGEEWCGYPRNKFGERTEQWYHLRDVNRRFFDKYGEAFDSLELESVYHYGTPYGDTQYYFDGCDDILTRFSGRYRTNAVISRFRDVKSQEICYFIVNNDLKDSDQYAIQFAEPYEEFNRTLWILPGHSCLIRLRKEENR